MNDRSYRGWLIVILLALASLGYTGFVRYQREVGRRDLLLGQSLSREKVAVATVVTLQREGDSLLRVVHSKESLLRVRAGRLTKAVAAYRNLRDTIQVTDSMAVRQALALADSAVLSAQSALEVADVVIANYISLTASLRSEIAAHERIEAALREQNRLLSRSVRGSRMANIARTGKWLAVGLVVGIALR